MITTIIIGAIALFIILACGRVFYWGFHDPVDKEQAQEGKRKVLVVTAVLAIFTIAMTALCAVVGPIPFYCLLGVIGFIFFVWFHDRIIMEHDPWGSRR